MLFGRYAFACKEYKIYRKENLGSYKVINVIPVAQARFVNHYFDTDVNVDRDKYKYIIKATDSCGEVIYTSNKIKTILLKGKTSDTKNLHNDLIWTTYFDSLLSNYLLNTIITNHSIRIPDFTIPASQYKYEYNVTDYSDEAEGKFEHWIGAQLKSKTIDNFTFSDTVHSNTVTLYQDEHFYIPNAFGSVDNPIFKPSFSFISQNDYKLLIHNRWGQKVFETNDVNVGWDGSFNGKPCQTGVYTYLIKYRNSENILKNKKGNVYLMR